MTNLNHPVRRRTRDAYPVLRPKPERIVVTLFPGDTLIFRCERRRQEWYLPIAAALRGSVYLNGGHWHEDEKAIRLICSKARSVFPTRAKRPLRAACSSTDKKTKGPSVRSEHPKIAIALRLADGRSSRRRSFLPRFERVRLQQGCAGRCSSDCGKGAVVYANLREEFVSTKSPLGVLKISMAERKLAILVVDDQPTAVVALIYGLEQAGCRVVLASSVEHALAVAATDDFDGALLDFQMPTLTGLELAEKLKLIAGSKAHTWPIWLMTGSPTPAIYERARELHIRNVFTKPFHHVRVINELVAGLSSVMSMEHAPQSGQDGNCDR